MQVMEELDSSEIKIEDILVGKKQMPRSAIYEELKSERETAKQLLCERMNRDGRSAIEKKADLSRFMGRLGALSAKVSQAKVTSDHNTATLQAKYEESQEAQTGQGQGRGEDCG